MQLKHDPFPRVGEQLEVRIPMAIACASTYNVWWKCQGGHVGETTLELPDWTETDDEFREGWQRGVGSTVPLIEAADGTPWETLSHHLYTNIQAAIADGTPYTGWECISREKRLLWEACARHLCNLLVYDVEDGRVEDFEDQMKLWFDAKMEAIKNG